MFRNGQHHLNALNQTDFLLSQVLGTAMTRKNAENAWVAKVPTWPLTLVFLGQLAAVGGGVYWVIVKGEPRSREQEISVVFPACRRVKTSKLLLCFVPQILTCVVFECLACGLGVDAAEWR